MEVSIPLCEVGSKILPATAVLEFTGTEPISQTSLTHNGGNIFCAFDGARAVVSTLEGKTGLFHVVCVLFFRQLSDGRHALNVTRTLKELLDVPEGLSYKPLQTAAEVHVYITESVLIEKAAVIGDAIVVASRCGCLGCVSLSSLSTPSPKGFLLASPPASRSLALYRWAFDAHSPHIVRVGNDSLTVCSLSMADGADRQGCEASLTMREVDLGDASVAIEDAASAACFREASEPAKIIVVLSYRTKRPVTVLKLTVGHATKLERAECATAQGTVDLTVFPRPSPCAYVESVLSSGAGGHLLAVLYPDCVVFGTVVDGLFSVSAVLKNELGLAYETGSWEAARGKTCRFLVFRADAVCLVYEVSFDSAAGLRIVEIALAAQFAIPFSNAVPLRGMGERVLAVKTVEALLRNVDGDAGGGDAVAFLQEPASCDFRPLNGDECFYENTTNHPPSSMQLLEVLASPHAHNVLTVLHSGECLLAATDKPGKRRIALVSNPHEVTSCLAFEREGETVCVLGFADGNVIVFIGERFSCLVRMAHCGPVDRLLYVADGSTDGTDAAGAPVSPLAAQDTTFVSMCTQLGTICFHTGMKAEITKTMTSPSRPLTSCYLDEQAEYLFAFSNLTGNLWHLPTCRLERTFTCSHKDAMAREGMVSLLAAHWTSTMGIQSLPFLGQIYYAVRVNIAKMTAELMATHRISRDVSYALALLLQCCGVRESGPTTTGAQTIRGGTGVSPLRPPMLADSALSNVLGQLSLGVQPSDAVGPGIGAIALTSAIVEASGDKVVASQAAALSIHLHEALLHNAQGIVEKTEHALVVYFAAFFTLGQAVPTTLRDGFGRMVACLSNEDVESIAVKLLSTYEQKAQQTNASSQRSPEAAITEIYADSFCFLAAVLAARHAATTMAKSSILQTLRASAKAKCTELSRNALSKAGALNDLTVRDRQTLLGLSEGYSLFAKLPEMRELVERLTWHAFEATNADTRHLCGDALSRITAHDVERLIRDTLEGCLQSRPAWRPRIIIFLAHFVKAFPGRAASHFSPLLELALKAISPHTAPASADERALSTDATMQLVRVAVTHLPNVSFQKHIQHLAVGQEDGKVKVYNLKTMEIVSAFQAHSHPVVCLSYSSTTVSYDIASTSTRLGKVKIFRCPKQSTSIVSFFAGGSNQFKLETQIDIPATEIPLNKKLLLLRFCGIKWLSPQCIEFSSPWHEKIQMTL